MKRLGILLIALATSYAAYAQSAGDNLFKAGKLREASEAWVKDSYAVSGKAAQDLLSKALTTDPDLKHIINLLQSVANNHKELLTKALSSKYLGLLYLASGQYSLARQWYTTAATLDSNDHESRQAYLALGLYEGKYEEVRVGIDQAMASKPPAEAIEGIGLVSALYLNATDRPTEALKMLDQVSFANIKPSAQALATGVYIAQNAKNDAKAKELYEKLTSLYPASPYALALRSDTSIKTSPLFLILGMASIPTGINSTKELPADKPQQSQNPSGNQTVNNQTTKTAETRVQLGVFSKKDYAYALFEKAKSKGFTPVVLEASSLYKVLCQVPTGETAERFLLRLRDAGFEGFIEK